MGLVKNYEQLITVRFLLGLTEAGLFPGMAYYLTLWYPRDKLQSRVGIFFGSATLAGAFSGLFAYWIGFMSGVGGRLGWAWIFIIEGAATILVGLVAFLVLVDFPATARFLTPEERSFVIHKQKMEYSNVGEEEHFEFRHIWAAITDWQLWAHVLIFWSIGTPLYGIAFFLPTIINSFGYTVSVSQLLTIPPYLVATILIYVWGYLSEKRKIRSPFLFASLAFSLIGLAINISNVSDGVKYFGTYWIVAGAAAAFPGIIAWLGNNLAGQYKRGTGMAIQLGLGNISGTFASNIYRNQDAPKFIFSHSIMIMFTGVGFIIVAVTTYVYKIINRRRERTLREMLDRGEKLKPEDIRKLGDKSPTFRYMI
ncbi:MFS general substrate transporter [Amanita muscaria]